MRRLEVIAAVLLSATLAVQGADAQSLHRARATLSSTARLDLGVTSRTAPVYPMRASSDRRPMLRNALIGFVVGGLVVAQISGGVTDAFCDAAEDVCRDNVHEARVLGAISGGLAGAAIGALIACARSPRSAEQAVLRESSAYKMRVAGER